MKNDIDRYLMQYQELYGSELFINDPSNEIEQLENIKDTILPHYLNSIKDRVECDLKNINTYSIFSEGNMSSKIIFINEISLQNKDLQDISFLDKADELLDRILLAINLTRKDVYILNILKYGFFEKRKHLVADMNEYVKFLKKKIEVIKPNAIVALGKAAAQTLLNNKDNTISSLRNKIHKYENIDLFFTHHPEELLKNSDLKKDAWEDFKKIKRDYIDG